MSWVTSEVTAAAGTVTETISGTPSCRSKSGTPGSVTESTVSLSRVKACAVSSGRAAKAQPRALPVTDSKAPASAAATVASISGSQLSSVRLMLMECDSSWTTASVSAG